MPPARFRRIALAGCALLGACNDTRDLAPASPDTPWQFEPSKEAPAPPAAAPAAAKRFTVPENTAVQLPSPADIDPNHVYSLVELIDIAQRRNPATRVAWEQARQAAINVGIARAAYLPALTASAVAGWEHVVFPFPSNLVPQGFIVFNAQEVYPQLTVNYLLLDFGGRAAAVEAAGQLSIAGNVAFTAAHQQLIFNVARAYFTLDGADAALRGARQGLADAKVVQQSAEALFGRGLDTIVDVQLARRATAQAQYDLAQAETAQHDAMYTLLAAMDLPPTTKLRVAGASERPLPPRTARTVDDVLSEALRQRPDLLADVAKLRATDAEIAAARSAQLPKVSLGANVQGNIGRLNVDNSPYLGVVKPQGAALLNFEWPLYDRRIAAEQVDPRPVEARRGGGRAKGAHRPGFARGGARLRPGRYGAAAIRCRDRAADRIRDRLPQRQRCLCARRRYVDRCDLRANGARHGAHRGGPGARAVADQRGRACLCDWRADLKHGFRHRDTPVMLLHGTG